MARCAPLREQLWALCPRVVRVKAENALIRIWIWIKWRERTLQTSFCNGSLSRWGEKRSRVLGWERGWGVYSRRNGAQQHVCTFRSRLRQIIRGYIWGDGPLRNARTGHPRSTSKFGCRGEVNSPFLCFFHELGFCQWDGDSIRSRLLDNGLFFFLIYFFLDICDVLRLGISGII